MAKVTMTEVVDGVEVTASSVAVDVAQGSRGPQGPKGDTGDTGPQGPKGDTGLQGIQGTQGVKGDKGDTGAAGATGPAGADGADGADGDDGRGIVSVTRTSGDGSEGTTDTYTITYTDATTSTFDVYNGADGTSGGGTGTVTSVNTVEPVDGDVTLTPADIGAATAAQGALADSATQPGDLATVATTGAYSALTGTPTIPDSADDIGAVPTTRTVNGHALSADVTVTAADVSAVPTTRTVNSKALSANITLSASDVGAAATTHTHAESDITNLTTDLAAKAPLASPALTGNPTAPTPTAGDNDTSIATTAFVTNAVAKQPEVFVFALGDETTAITTGTKVTWRIPFAFTLASVRGSLTTASSSGNPAFDVKKNGTSIFSTTLTIDSGEKTSTTAATAAVLSTTAFADDDEVTFIVNTAGTGAAGAKITLIGTRA